VTCRYNIPSSTVSETLPLFQCTWLPVTLKLFHLWQPEGAQRVHISAKYMILLWCTRLHVYISTSLVMYLRSRRLPMIMTSSIMTVCCGITGVCRKSIENGVDIFVHFFTTPMSILNLTMSSESQENDVSNDILSERKYSQLFTHKSNIFLLKQLYQFTDAVRRWRHSLFIHRVP